MKRSFAVITLGVSTLCASLAYAVGWDDEWRMKPTNDSDKVRFSIERVSYRNHWNMTSDVPIDRFKGLTMTTVEKGGKASFEYIRDAGKLVCEGYFNKGYGIGAFQFVPNPHYTTELQRLGFEAPAERDLFAMTMSDVSLDFARGVQRANVPATTKQLLEMRIHGIDVAYIDNMRATGYTTLSGKDYVEMKIHGVTPDLVSELKKAGYDIPAKRVVEMKIHGVSPAYIRELNSYGLKPDASEIVEMKIHGVQPDYLKALKTAGHENLGVREVVNMRIHGVNPEFVQEAKQLGFNFSPKELTELRIHGVNGQYLRKLKDSGFKNLTAQNIVKLKIHGID